MLLSISTADVELSDLIERVNINHIVVAAVVGIGSYSVSRLFGASAQGLSIDSSSCSS